MSQTISALCDDCKTKVWFGQVWHSDVNFPGAVSVYQDEKPGWGPLYRFLYRHLGHRVRVVPDVSDEGDGYKEEQ